MAHEAVTSPENRYVALQDVFARLWHRSRHSITPIIATRADLPSPQPNMVILETMIDPDTRSPGIPSMAMWCIAFPIGEFANMHQSALVDHLIAPDLIPPPPEFIYRWHYVPR